MWSQQRTLDQRIIDAYYGEHLVAAPDLNKPERKRKFTVKRLTTSEVGRIIDLIWSLYSGVPALGVMNIGDTNRTEKQREDVSVALMEALDQLNPATDGPANRICGQIVALGRGAYVGPLSASAYYYDFPERTDGTTEKQWRDRLAAWRGGGPSGADQLLWLDLPPENTFPGSWGSLNEEVLSWTAMSYADLCEVFGDEALTAWKAEKADQASEQYTLCVYSNRQYIAYHAVRNAVHGQRGIGPISWGGTKGHDALELRVHHHGLGRSAVRIAGGKTGWRKEPGKFWMSGVFHALDLALAADRMLTAAGASAEYNLFPLLKRTRIHMLEEGAKGNNEDIFEGDIAEVWIDPESGKAEDIEPIYMPQAGEQNLQLLLTILERTARITGAAEVLEGVLGGAGETAWSRNIKIETAKGKLEPITQGVVAMWIDASANLMQSVGNFGETVELFHKDQGKIALEPEMVDGLAPILKAEYKLKFPANKIADLQMMLEMMAQAMSANIPIDPFWAMENFGGIERPMEHFENYIQHKALLDERVQRFLIDRRLQELQVELAEEEGLDPAQVLADPTIPEDVKAALLEMEAAKQGAQQQNGAMPMNGGGPMQGAAQAGAPLSRRPGGPTPVERLR